MDSPSLRRALVLNFKPWRLERLAIDVRAKPLNSLATIWKRTLINGWVGWFERLFMKFAVPAIR